MAFDTAWVKSHWYYIAGAVLGLLVLYELLKSIGGASSSSSQTDLSGGGQAVSNIQAAADLQNAQVNGQTTVAAYAAGVQSNQIAAALQLGEVQTAAQLDATNHQTQAAETVALAADKTTLGIQQIRSNQAVQTAAIEGATYEHLADTNASVQTHVIDTVGGQIKQILDNSKHASQDLTAFAPIVAEETGQGGSAGPLAGANAASRVAGSAITSTAISAGSSLLKGLFVGSA